MVKKANLTKIYIFYINYIKKISSHDNNKTNDYEKSGA